MGKFFRTRAFIAMCIIAVLLLGLSLLSMSERGKVSIFEDIFGIIVTPLQKASNRLVGASGNFKRVFTEYDTLQQENENLKEQLAQVKEQLRAAEQDIMENKTLRGALKLAEEHPEFTFTSAHVSAMNLDGYTQSLTLNKGSVHGIHRRDLVITGEGVVGYVSDIGTTWCKVTTILDSSLELGVVLTRTGQTAVLQGDATLATDARCRLSYIKNDITLSVGDTIETSSVGGLFPEGLLVGSIREIQSDPSGLSQYAIVEPAVAVNELDTVLVITDFTGKDKD